jgi:D-alanine transaminase
LAKEVAPVVRLDGVSVGDGVPGPWWQRMHALFQDFKQRLLRGDVD